MGIGQLIVVLILWPALGGLFTALLTHHIVKRQEQIIKQSTEETPPEVKEPTLADIASIIIVDGLPPCLTDIICGCITARVGFMLRSEYVTSLLSHETLVSLDIWIPYINNGGTLDYSNAQYNLLRGRWVPLTEIWSHGYLQYATSAGTTLTIDNVNCKLVDECMIKQDMMYDTIIPAKDDDSPNINGESLLIHTLPDDITHAIEYRRKMYLDTTVPIWFTIMDHPLFRILKSEKPEVIKIGGNKNGKREVKHCKPERIPTVSAIPCCTLQDKDSN